MRRGAFEERFRIHSCELIVLRRKYFVSRPINSEQKTEGILLYT